MGTWGDQLEGRKTCLFVDNQAAIAVLVAGRCKENLHAHVMVEEIWAIINAKKIIPYFEYVESKANCSDAPSRMAMDDAEGLQKSFDEMILIGCEQVEVALA